MFTIFSYLENMTNSFNSMYFCTLDQERNTNEFSKISLDQIHPNKWTFY